MITPRAILLSAALLLTAGSLGAAVEADDEAFRHQWYDQGAEISSYQLQQSRYGAIRDGHAVLIFVTEPFNTAAQVKSDDPDAADAVPALKLNATRTFLTGVYPYSTMTSTFRALDTAAHPHVYKATTSVQEWCGHVFEQLNRQNDAWRWRLFSYFESEGDSDQQLPGVHLEDGLWTLLRLDPSALPTGEIQLIPDAIHRRFAHQSAQVEQATAHLGPAPSDQSLRVYTITYQSIDRELAITFQADFPYRIQSWRETTRGDETTATLKRRIMDPYWRHNRPGDEVLREQLGLSTER